MVTTVILGMLCVYLLCFSVMFLLISTRLNGKKMGMEVFALGNLLLGLAYILQLFGGPPDEGLVSVINHTLTLSAPVVYVLGAMRFFERPTPVLRPLLTLMAGYTLLQLLVQWLLGTEARHAMLAAACASLFLAMTVADIVAGSVVIEQVFSLPGLGRMLLTSIANRDYPVVQAVVVIVAFWVVLVNLLADLINQRLDPRLRLT